MRIGTWYIADGKCDFMVWAPFAETVSVRILNPIERIFPMKAKADGYWHIAVDQVLPGTLYVYRLDGKRDRPDPASHFQPKGVNGPSQVVDHQSFRWQDDNWKGVALSSMIMYELHVGTFTPEGSFKAIIQRLGSLRDTGINAIEIMPVAQFPGDRNWGYDGVYSFAVQSSYGGPAGLKYLVDACHQQDIAVILDVVYNHLGPEGNYLSDFGPYFTDKYQTHWGMAINFDDAYSDEVRNFFIENAFYWFQEYHIDALRLDAVHAICDLSAKPFLQELTEETQTHSKRTGRKRYLIAETDLNDARVIRPREEGGYGLDAQWCDDFHHSLHTLLTGEDQGYYLDFGQFSHLIKAVRDGYVYSGQYSQYRKRKHGNSSIDRPAEQFVVYSQNHDHIGNRADGYRLSGLITFEGLKLAAGIVLLSPHIPMIFMGEEYAEDSPFYYFVSHSDPGLIEAVREGRKEEFKVFKWKEEPPDPQNAETFLRSKLNWEKRNRGDHRVMLDFYKNLIRLRKENPALSLLDKNQMEVRVTEENRVLLFTRSTNESKIYGLFNFNEKDVALHAVVPKGNWRKLMDSSEKIWSGPGTLLPRGLRGLSFSVFEVKG